MSRKVQIAVGIGFLLLVMGLFYWGQTKDYSATFTIGGVDDSPKSKDAKAVTYIVNTTEDSVEGLCTNGGSGANDCSLRQAIMQANGGTDSGISYAIQLTSREVYRLSLFDDGEGPEDVQEAANDLDIFTAIPITIQGNGAVVDAGSLFRAFHVDNGANLAMNDVTVRNGTSTNGGGLLLVNRGRLTLENCVLKNGVAPGKGGAILSIGGTVILSEVTVESSSAFAGGGIYISGGSANISESMIQENSAVSRGGGIVMDNNADLKLITSGVTGNTLLQTDASDTNGDSSLNAMGVGLSIDSGSATVRESTFSNNAGTIDYGQIVGGAIYLAEAGELKAQNSTFDGNTVDAVRNGDETGTTLYNDGGTVTMLHVTSTGTMVYTEDARTTLTASIQGSSCGLSFLSAGTNSIESGGYNVVASGCDDSEFEAIETDQLATLDALNALAKNGGTTKTKAFTDPSASLAVNTIPLADCTLDGDQRGMPRTGFCDAGAYEHQDTTAPVISAPAVMTFSKTSALEEIQYSIEEASTLSDDVDGDLCTRVGNTVDLLFGLGASGTTEAGKVYPSVGTYEVTIGTTYENYCEVEVLESSKTSGSYLNLFGLGGEDYYYDLSLNPAVPITITVEIVE